MNRWNLTPARLEYVRKQLKGQSSVEAIADHYGISPTTLYKELKKVDIDVKSMKSIGLAQLRRSTFALISRLDDKDQFDAGMKYLSRYEKLEGDTAEDTAVDDDSIVSEILTELS